jgi:hypothetical protein
MIHDKEAIDSNTIVQALLGALGSSEPQSSFDSFSVVALIKTLQSDLTADFENVARVEWSYLTLLDHEDASPIFLERRLALDPNFFCELIRKIYRSTKEQGNGKEVSERDQSFATNAWRLFHEWHTPPGFASGTFSKMNFQVWLKKVKSSCSKSGHLGVAFTHLGQVLFYSPPDQNGLWINKTIASTLNGGDADEMRKGFYMEAHNSRGAHFVDPTGKPELELEADYLRKADQVETEGYHRFATILREIADSFKRQAEQIKNDGL